MQAEQDQIQYILIGIGLNVNQTKDDLHQDIQSKATSLRIETDNEFSIKNIIQELLVAFEKSFDNYIEQGFLPIKKKWESYGFKMGKDIVIKTFKDIWRAPFLGISDDGALCTESKQGKSISLYSAEIEWFDE